MSPVYNIARGMEHDLISGRIKVCNARENSKEIIESEWRLFDEHYWDES